MGKQKGNKKETLYSERIAISKYNKDRLQGVVKDIRLKYYPDERHRKKTFNELVGHCIDVYTDERTM